MEEQHTPTRTQVQKQEARAAALEQQAKELEEQERELANQIAECHASGAGDRDALTRQRREVRVLWADILEALPLVRARLTADREQAAKAEAEKRMRGIARAHGSLRQELDDDDARVREAATAYKAAADRLNQRYRSLAMLGAEAGALCDRFGVAAPMFAPVVIPAMRKVCGAAALVVDGVKFLDHAHVRTATEKCEHGLRTRRTYAEIAGTGGGIIKAAGLKPWPELNAKQREIVESRVRERQAEAATAARFEGEAARGLQRTGLV